MDLNPYESPEAPAERQLTLSKSAIAAVVTIVVGGIGIGFTAILARSSTLIDAPVELAIGIGLGVAFYGLAAYYAGICSRFPSVSRP